MTEALEDITGSKTSREAEALWCRFGDGKRVGADAAFAKFKVLATKADGMTEAKTLAQLDITEIDLTGDANMIQLPDGSLITGQTNFPRGHGTTGTVADEEETAKKEGLGMIAEKLVRIGRIEVTTNV